MVVVAVVVVVVVVVVDVSCLLSDVRMSVRYIVNNDLAQLGDGRGIHA